MPFLLSQKSRIISNLKMRKNHFYYGWVVLAACLVINIVSVGMRLSFGVFFKPLEVEFGLTRATTSGIFSAYLIICGLVGIIGGWALDRYSPKKVFILTGLLSGLGLLLTSQATALWHIFLSYSLLLALGTGSTFVIVMTLVSKWFTQGRRGLALGIVSCGAGIGMTIMPPIANYFISAYDWQTSYLVLALIAFFILIPCALLLKRSPGEVATSVSLEKLAATTPVSDKEKHDDEPKQPSLAQAIKTRNFWLLFFMMFLWAVCSYIVLAHIVRHAIDLQISAGQAATVLTIIGGTSIPGRLLMGRLSDVKGSKYASIIYALILIASMLWLIWASNLWMLYVFAVPFGLCFGASAPLVALLIGDAFGTRYLGTILGVLETGWASGSAFGPVLAGYIYDTNYNYALAFIIGIIAILITLLLIALLKMPNSRREVSAVQ